MKNGLRCIIFTLLILIANYSFCQLILTESDLPAIGDVKINIKVDTLQAASLYEGSAGENQIWDFSNLNACCGYPGSTDTTQWYDSRQIDPNSNFPDAVLATKAHCYTYHSHVTHTDITVCHYNYYEKDSQGLKLYGIENPVYSLSEPSQLIQPILSYGQTVVIHSKMIFNLSSDSTRILSITDTISADAWGLLMTPADTVSTLRYKKSQVTVDSLFVSDLQPSVEVRQGKEWTWQTNGVHFPLLVIREGSLSNIFTGRSAEYLQSSQRATGIIDPEVKNLNVKVYPNPFNSGTTFYLGFPKPVSKVSLSVFDMTGKEVRKIEGITGDQFIFDRGRLNPGVYFYLIYASEVPVSTGKLVVN